MECKICMGYIPISAHLELHFNLNSIQAFKELKKAGCLLHANALSFFNHYGSDVTKKPRVYSLKTFLILFVLMPTRYMILKNYKK